MDTRELLDILARARELITDDAHWSPVHFATDEVGRWVPVGSTHALRFNLQGAVIRAAGRLARDAINLAESLLGSAATAPFATTLNSSRVMNHVEALAWLDVAISRIAGGSGIRLRVTPLPEPPRKTTGTGGDDS